MDPTNKITMTGCQLEGTPGRELLDRERAEIDGHVMPISSKVQAEDFSAHADRDGLLKLLSAYGDATILINHGDRCEAFTEELRAEGFDATAPKLDPELAY
jgi:putative mRNA 3-end processing factor